MKAILAGLFAFGAVLALRIGWNMAADAEAVMTGAVVGVALLVPVAVFLLLHRANEAQTRRNLAGIGAQTATETRGGLVSTAGAYLPYTPHTRPPTGHGYPTGHPRADTEYRTYGYEMPSNVKIRRYRKMLSGDAAAVAGPIEIETRRPHRAPDTRADVAVPASQAIITAFIAALCAGVLAAVAGRGDTLRVVAVVFVGVLALAWLWRLGVVDSLLQTIERVTQTDIDGDGEIGNDPTHGMTINAGAARQEAGRRERSSERAIRLADLLAFAQRCATVGCAERAQGIRAGTPAQEAYRAKRDLLIMLGIGKWRNPENHNAGWVLAVNAAEAAELLRRHVMDVSST